MVIPAETIFISPRSRPADSGNAARTSGLLLKPPAARAIFSFAHGAGAGMTHAFMESVAAGLAARGVATWRFNFPFIETMGEKRFARPDKPEVAQAFVREAARRASELAPGLPLFAGGKSFGARMTTQAQAAHPLEGVRGLILIGFPLHPPRKPATVRAAHLSAIQCPMLFVQGARDEMATIALVREISAAQETRRLHEIEGANHAFAAPAKFGKRGEEIIAEICSAIGNWIDATIAAA